MRLAGSFSDEPSNEIQLFTNREKHQDWFTAKTNIRAGELPRIPATMLFGPGAIGKSWLLRHLERQLASPRRVPSVRIDFTREGVSNPLCDDPSAALAAIRRISKAECPRFDIATKYLLVEKGVRDESTLNHPARKMAASIGDDLFKRALGLIPGVGGPLQATYEIVEILYPYARNKLGLRDLMHKDLRRLRELRVEDIERGLVERLVDDLRDVFPAQNDHAVKAVVFVDTLEALQPVDSTQYNLKIRTQWLRDLIRDLNDRVLFILAGQNQLAWGDLESCWKDSTWLKQIPVDGLSTESAREFLQRCGLEQPDVQEAIVTACQSADGTCHTFHMSLLADFARMERRKNNGVIDTAIFASLPPDDWTKLILRFMQSLPSRSHEYWIRRLSLTPEFDEAAARSSHSAQRSIFQDADWAMLRSFSFLVDVEGKQGWWTIHSTMQRAISEEFVLSAPDHWRESHQSWRSYWQDRAPKPTDAFAQLAWYHLWHLDSAAAVEEWKQLIETARTGPPIDMVFHYQLLSWLDPLHLQERRKWTEFEALLSSRLAKEYYEASLGDRIQNLRKASTLLHRALQVLTVASLPDDWARAQNRLGLVYASRIDGDRAENMREAIACYQRALEVRKSDGDALAWSATQNNLGDAWRDRPDGERPKNIEQAIACYERALSARKEKETPIQWAQTQSSLGRAWWCRPDGVRATNLRQAIERFEIVLPVLEEHGEWRDWATSQNFLGLAWMDLSDGNIEENFNTAIACFHHALEVWTKDSHPRGWAWTQAVLGNVWRDFPNLSHEAENLQKAIACYKHALDILRRESFPEAWASVQCDLGRVHIKQKNYDEAIGCYRLALEVQNPKSYPRGWAATQHELGSALRNRAGANRVDYLRDAVSCYTRALEIRTKTSYPLEWATTLSSLGRTYRILKDFQQAIACFQSALEVWTTESSPQNCATMHGLLGDTWLERIDGNRKENILEAIACYKRALEIQTNRSDSVEQAATQQKLDNAVNLLRGCD
jgi:tetratricopeptide (TPR) repeat protein